jgi:peptidoglycan/LPS O-acetylase OafA/YrhL
MINLGHSAYLNDMLALLYLGLVIAVSSLTYRFIEDPARHFFNRIAKQTDRTVLATAV